MPKSEIPADMSFKTVSRDFSILYQRMLFPDSPAHLGAFSSGNRIKAFFGSSRNLGGRAAWGRVCGRAKLGAGTLRCLHLCWRLPWNWSDAKQLGRCPKPHKGRCPLALQGADEKGRSPPLDLSARLGWSRFHASSACSFLVLRLSPCLPPTFREEPKKYQNSLWTNSAGCF